MIDLIIIIDRRQGQSASQIPLESVIPRAIPGPLACCHSANASGTEHAWVHWRSMYVVNPEGLEVELVCNDETVK